MTKVMFGAVEQHQPTPEPWLVRMSIKYINGINERLTRYIWQELYISIIEVMQPCWQIWYYWTIRNVVVLKGAHKSRSRWHGSPYMATEISSDLQSPVPICIMMKGYTTKTYRWPKARPQRLRCVGNGATAVPHAPSHRYIILFFPQKSGDTRWDNNGSENDEWYNNLINPVTGMLVSREICMTWNER